MLQHYNKRKEKKLALNTKLGQNKQFIVKSQNWTDGIEKNNETNVLI
jgi:hypothetical protein